MYIFVMWIVICGEHDHVVMKGKFTKKFRTFGELPISFTTENCDEQDEGYGELSCD